MAKYVITILHICIICGMTSIGIISAVIEDRVIGPDDYCYRDVFNASCKDSEVIIISKALLGRMQFGRCVKRNMGFLGECVKNVTKQLASVCSGRRMCNIKVQNDIIYSHNPCVSDLTPYLEVTYKCVKVLTHKGSKCEAGNTLLTKNQSGLLTTDVSSRKGWLNCPWKITVQPGQKIKLNIYSYIDKSDMKENASNTKKDICIQVASVKEKTREIKLLRACSLHSQQNVYTSFSNEIEIQLSSVNRIPQSNTFLIFYQAIGCPNIVPVGKSSISYLDGTAKIRCNDTDEEWYLTCKGTTWIGKPKKCSDRSKNELTHDKMTKDNTFPFALVIAVAIGVALGVFCGGMLLTFVAVHNKRRQNPNQSPKENIYYGVKQMSQPLPVDPFHQAAVHYCTNVNHMNKHTTVVAPPHTPCLAHRGSAASLDRVGSSECKNHQLMLTAPQASPEPSDFTEYFIKSDQQPPDLFLLDKNSTILKDRLKYGTGFEYKESSQTPNQT